MARMMIGRDLPVPRHGAPARRRRRARSRLAGLSHRGATTRSAPTSRTSISTVRGGEIVGIAGVSGNGQQELLRAVSGEEPLAEKYPVQILGSAAGRLRPARRRALGMGFVPEERLGRGAVPRMTLAENALLTAHRRSMVRTALIDFAAVDALRRSTASRRFDVKCGGPEALAKSLSGGNLQKFIVGREILQQPRLLVVAQPTWGVDVGAAAFIRQSLIDLRDAGTAILVISEELDELFEICDRIAVIAKGRLSPAKRDRRHQRRGDRRAG